MAKRKRCPSDKPGRKYYKKGEPYEPNEIHMGWYHEHVVEQKTFSQIARENGIQRQAVHQAVHRVEEWLKAELIDYVIDYRMRGTALMRAVINESFQAWKRSIGKSVVTTERKGVGAEGQPIEEITNRTEQLAGDPRFIAEIRAAGAEINKLWGAYETPKSKVEVNTPGDQFDCLERVSGKSREEALRDQAQALLAMADEESKAALQQP